MSLLSQRIPVFFMRYESTDKVQLILVQQSTNFHATKKLDINYCMRVKGCESSILNSKAHF